MAGTTMSAEQILKELSKLGSESYRATMLRHGAPDSILGVSIAELKKYQKKIKKDYELSLALYDTGVSEAMYLAGLIADETRIKKKDLERWAKKATWGMIGEYTVPWVAAESPFGEELGLAWIDSKDEQIAAGGWCTLAGMVAVRPDDELDLKLLEKLMGRVVKTIHKAPNRVRYTMNSFIIAVGSYVAPLTDKAVAAAKQIGKVTVDMGDTECKVPSAVEYIGKVAKAGRVGRKRATTRC